MWLTPKLFSSSATLIRSPGLISPASSARRSRTVTLSTTLTRWIVSLPVALPTGSTAIFHPSKVEGYSI